MSNDTHDEAHNALHHVTSALRLERNSRPRYPRAIRRPAVLAALQEAESALLAAIRAAD